MKHVAILDADTPAPVTTAVGLPVLIDAATALSHLPASDPAAETAIVDLLCAVLAAYEEGAEPAHSGAALASLSPAQAARAFNLLLLSRWPEGEGDPATLDDAALLALVGLAVAAGRADQAAALLAGETACRRTPGFLAAAFAARCRLADRAAGLPALWSPLGPGMEIADARNALEADPLNLTAHRALGRELAEAGDTAAALAALGTALTLPLPAREKFGVAEDFGVLALVLASAADGAALAQPRIRAALAGNPALAAHAAAYLRAEPVLAMVADPEAWTALTGVLDDYAAALPALVAPFPAGPDGKPKVNMVFLEITNHCNQKCSFCPDMHREIARTWLPLDTVTRLIDEIADGMTANMLQLNAYGEPLLHPHIDKILAHVRAKRMPWPTFMTTHGLTLNEKKLRQLSRNYPSGIAVSLHNDGQDSYQRSRNNRIGDYPTMVARVSALMRQMVAEGADCHLRLYQLVCNGREDPRVPAEVQDAFARTPERFAAHVRHWEAIAAEVVDAAPPEVHARAIRNPDAKIERAFWEAADDLGVPLPLLEWTDIAGHRQQAFMSARPIETYANLLNEYHPDWEVERRLVNADHCRFLDDPSLTIFASGRLGFCCLDLNNTATFGSLGDYADLAEAIASPEARRMVGELMNGVAVSPGCQICLSSGVKRCG
jgi:hypothetical protein